MADIAACRLSHVGEWEGRARYRDDFELVASCTGCSIQPTPPARSGRAATPPPPTRLRCVTHGAPPACGLVTVSRDSSTLCPHPCGRLMTPGMRSAVNLLPSCALLSLSPLNAEPVPLPLPW